MHQMRCCLTPNAQIDNDLVRRQLIINHGVEQMLLIEKVDEASAILFDRERPRNVRRCYSLDRTGRRGGFHLSYSRAGEPVQAPVPAYTGKPRIKSDLASQIRYVVRAQAAVNYTHLYAQNPTRSRRGSQA